MPNHPKFRAVLFDLDGTLLDTLADLGGSVNRVLEKHGWPTHPIDDYKYFVGEGARLLVERAIPEAHRDKTTVEACLQEYREMYAKHWKDSTQVYPGIPELLDELTARNIALGVLSNKPDGMTRKCVEHFLSKWTFKAILGQRDEVARKPDPSGALEAARLMGVGPTDVLYVGDTATDMETATAAGMFPLGITWGFRPESELLAHGARTIAHDPRDIFGFLRG